MYPAMDHITAVFCNKSTKGYYDDEEYRAGRRLLKMVTDQQTPNVAVFALIIVKAECIQEGKEKANSHNQTLLALEKKLNYLFNYPPQNLDRDIFTTHAQQIVKIHSDIEEIVSFRTKEAKVRCQADWLEGGEKCSSYFFNLEKDRFNRKTINRLKKPDGTQTDDPMGIMTLQMDFYSKLFISIGIIMSEEYLENMQIP